MRCESFSRVFFLSNFEYTLCCKKGIGMCNNRKIFLFLVWNLYFFSSLSAPIISKKIVSLSIPKSGSHLLAKCLELITHNTMYSFFPKNLSVGNIHALLTNAEYGSIAFSHLEYKA